MAILDDYHVKFLTNTLKYFFKSQQQQKVTSGLYRPYADWIVTNYF